MSYGLPTLDQMGVIVRWCSPGVLRVDAGPEAIELDPDAVGFWIEISLNGEPSVRGRWAGNHTAPMKIAWISRTTIMIVGEGAANLRVRVDIPPRPEDDKEHDAD